MNDDRIIAAPDLGYIPHPGGLGCTLYEKMWEHQDKLAQIDAPTDNNEHYWSLLRRCAHSAIEMKSLGISSQDTVLIYCNNSTNACVPFIATLFIDAIAVIFNSPASIKNIVCALKEVKPKLIFTENKNFELMKSAIDESRMPIKITIFSNSCSESCKSLDEESTFRPVRTRNLKETAVIVFDLNLSTKGVCLNHYGLIKSAYNFGYLLPTKRILSFLPFSNIAAISTLIAAILYGSCRITVNNACVTGIWNILNLYQPNLLFFDEQLLSKIPKRPENIVKMNLRNVLILQNYITEIEVNNYKNVFHEASVLVTYWQIELCGLVSSFIPHVLKETELMIEKPTSSGKLLPGYSFKIVDTHTEKILRPNEVGELRVTSEYLMNGYYKCEWTEFLDSEGWFKTGKLAYYDNDHCLFLKNDITNIIMKHSGNCPKQLLEGQKPHDCEKNRPSS